MGRQTRCPVKIGKLVKGGQWETKPKTNGRQKIKKNEKMKETNEGEKIIRQKKQKAEDRYKERKIKE